MPRHVGQIGHHRQVHEAGTSRPAILGPRIRQHRHIPEVGQVLFPLAAQRVVVEVSRTPPAPVQPHRPPETAGRLQRRDPLHNGLDGRKARAAGQQHHRLVTVLAQEEGAERPLQPEDLTLLQRRPRAHPEHPVGEMPARQVADVQLHVLQRAGRRGHGIAAPHTVGEDQVHVLAGQILQPLGKRQLQPDTAHVRCQRLDGAHPTGQLAHRDVAGPVHHRRLDGEVRRGRGRTQQRIALRHLFRRQRRRQVLALLYTTVRHQRLARPTGAVLAAIRQHNALVQRGFQHRGANVHLELAAAGRDRHVVSHVSSPVRIGA